MLGEFAAPPREYRPETWFQVSGGNFSKVGSTLDLEAIAGAGFMGVHFFHEQAGESVAWPGVAEQVSCMSPKWEVLVGHLGDECRRLGGLLMDSRSRSSVRTARPRASSRRGAGGRSTSAEGLAGLTELPSFALNLI